MSDIDKAIEIVEAMIQERRDIALPAILKAEYAREQHFADPNDGAEDRFNHQMDMYNNSVRETNLLALIQSKLRGLKK